MDDIAIVGRALRVPGAAGPEDFWKLLSRRQRAISRVPAQRWDARRVMRHRDDIARGESLDWGGFLDDIDLFDADFFGIGGAEADVMDPQQRLILEAGQRCAEDAGLCARALRGARGGVYVGISSYDYNRLMGRDYRRIDAHAAVGTSLFAAPNRLSWFFKLEGPSVAVDAACASSFVALQQAVAALRRGEIDLAFVGGVNAILTPDVMLSFAQAGLLAEDGRCRAFDARADGYVRAEACAMVALKRARDARADGDRILAVVRAVELAQAGHRQAFMAPQGLAQERLLRRTWEAAGIGPSDLGYVEAHANGTRLGDAIELTALQGAFAAAGRDRPCPVGSYKPCIGYPESASGLVGLVKVLSVFEHGLIPGQLDFEEPNPTLAECGLLEVSAADRAWAPGARPRFAALTALGAGGTYAHVVLEEAPAAAPATATAGAGRGAAPAWILPLSARTPDGLRRLAAEAAQSLCSLDDAALARACGAAARRRDHFACRLLVHGADAAELRRRLLLAAPPAAAPPRARRRPVGVDIVWSGSREEGDALVAALASAGVAASLSPASGGGVAVACAGGGAGDPAAAGRAVRETIAAFYEAGGDPDWTATWPGPVPPAPELPGHPFAATRHWVAPPSEQAWGSAAGAQAAL
jgi:acyl transferase domain-containing protein